MPVATSEVSSQHHGSYGYGVGVGCTGEREGGREMRKASGHGVGLGRLARTVIDICIFTLQTLVIHRGRC